MRCLLGDFLHLVGSQRVLSFTLLYIAGLLTALKSGGRITIIPYSNIGTSQSRFFGWKSPY